MDDRVLAETFSELLDALLLGKEVETQSQPEGIRDALSMAQQLIAVDFSTDSRVRDPLRSRLLHQVSQQSAVAEASSSSTELSDEDLMDVAGGKQAPRKSGCSQCGCARKSAQIEEEICPDCAHLRHRHE